MPSGEPRADYDLVVYGATSGGCVQDIDVARLRALLRAQGQILPGD